MAKYYRELNPLLPAAVTKNAIATLSPAGSSEAYQMSIADYGPVVVPAAYSNIRAQSIVPQNMVTGAGTDIYTPSVLIDSGAEFTVTDPTCNINVNADGWYLIHAKGGFETASWAAGNDVYFRLNSISSGVVAIETFRVQASISMALPAVLTDVVNLLTTDTYRLQINHNRSANLNLAGATLSVIRIA